MADPAATGPVQIHKYPNRRYYDTSASRYVTLEQLHEMIRAGREIRVSDSRTGEDITAKVLAQIILETEPLKLNAIPLNVLHELIRVNSRAAGDLWEGYFNQAMRAIAESRRSVEQGVRQAMELRSGPQAMLPDWLRMVWGPLAPPSFLFTGGASGGTPSPPPEVAPPAPQEHRSATGNSQPPAGPEELSRLVEQLTLRLAALEARLAEQKQQQKRPPRHRPR